MILLKGNNKSYLLQYPKHLNWEQAIRDVKKAIHQESIYDLDQSKDNAKRILVKLESDGWKSIEFMTLEIENEFE